jgi:hypothetical protein
VYSQQGGNLNAEDDQAIEMKNDGSTILTNRGVVNEK